MIRKYFLFKLITKKLKRHSIVHENTIFLIAYENSLDSIILNKEGYGYCGLDRKFKDEECFLLLKRVRVWFLTTVYIGSQSP